MKYEALKDLFRNNAMDRKFRPRLVCIIDLSKPQLLICGMGDDVKAEVDLSDTDFIPVTERGELFVFGRGEKADLDLSDHLLPEAADNSVSRYHCFIRREDVRDDKGKRSIYALYDCSCRLLWTAVKPKK